MTRPVPWWRSTSLEFVLAGSVVPGAIIYWLLARGQSEPLRIVAVAAPALIRSMMWFGAYKHWTSQNAKNGNIFVRLLMVDLALALWAFWLG